MRTIELSTVLFYRGELPREIDLSACSLPLARPPRDALCMLYGTQGKQDGLAAARAYAASQGLIYTVIDIIVDLEEQNSLPMKPADLPLYDFLNLTRMSRALSVELSDDLAQRPSLVRGDPALPDELSAEPLRSVMARRPALIDPLQDLKSCRHLKVIAFQAVTLLSSRAITIGCVPHRHWAAIREATCRLDPQVHVKLAKPT